MLQDCLNSIVIFVSFITVEKQMGQYLVIGDKIVVRTTRFGTVSVGVMVHTETPPTLRH